MTNARWWGAGWLCVFLAGAPSQARTPDNVVESVSVQGVGKFVKVVIQTTHVLKYREVAQGDTGVVIYMLEPVAADRPPLERTFSDMVGEIRYGYRGDPPAPGEKGSLEFINIRFKEPAAVSVVQQEWVLAVDVRPARGGVATPRPAPGTDSKAPVETRARLPENPVLDDFLRVGLANHMPLQIAEGELEVSHMRVMESLRNLMPAVTWRYSESEGILFEDPLVSTDDTKFRRRENGLEFGVPLFHSGRNYHAYRAASAQKRASQQNARKVKGESIFEITRAYYNLIKTQRVLAARRVSHERAEKAIALARQKKQLGLATPADHLGAESIYEQSRYRLLSDEKDLEIAHLKMAALLNINDPLPQLTTQPPDAVDPRTLVQLTLPPESLIRAARDNRPDLKAAEYIAEAQAHSQRAAWAENMLRLDGTYFTGQAGGAFESDSLEMRHSWNAGLQASMAFGGSTARGAATQEHTVPDYSETTASDVKGRTFSLGLLDGLRAAADARQAIVNRDRAAYESQEALRQAEVDVREAYYNIQKAKIQIKGAQIEMDYREKELAIARHKERMNLLEPQQTLAAEIAHMDAIQNHEEALAFYRTSLAGLERAVGAPLASIPEFR